MKKPVTKYALREVVRNGTVHPQIVFTITAQEIAELSHKIPRIRPSLVIAPQDAPEVMTVLGLNKHVSGNTGFKAEKDPTLAYMIFARRAMKHNHIVKIMAWHAVPDGYEETLKDDDAAKQAGYISPNETFVITPREFRKNIRLPANAAAQKFYQRMLPPANADETMPSGRVTLKIFSRHR